MQSPEIVIQNWIKGISKKSWLVFGTSLVAGIFTHIFVWTNRFYGADDIAYMFNDIYFGRAIQESRIGSWLIQQLLSDMGSSAMQVGLSLLLLAVTGVCIVSALRIENAVFAVLTGLYLVTFPTVACYFGYMSISFGFFAALFFAVWSVWLLERKGSKLSHLFLSICFLVMSLMIYQAMLPVTIAMMYLAVFRSLVRGTEWKAFRKKILRYLSVLVVSLGVFLTISGALKKIFAVDSIDYMGHENMATLDPSAIIQSLVDGVRQVFQYYLTDVYVYMSAFRYAGIAAGVIGCVAVILLFVKAKGVAVKVVMVMLTVMAPICLDTMFLIMNGRGYVHRLMIICLIFVPIGIMMAAEDARKNLLQWIVVAAVCVQIYCGYSLCNQAYVRMNNTYEATFSVMTRLVDRLEQMPEWKADGSVPVYFYNGSSEYGYFLNENYQPHVEEYENIDAGYLMMGTGINSWFAPHHYQQYFKIFLSMDVTLASQEQIDDLKLSEALEEMDIFPAKSAVQYVDGVIVVRMN